MSAPEGPTITVEYHGLVFSALTGARAGLVEVTRAVDGRNVDQFRVSPAPGGTDAVLAAAVEWVSRRAGAVPPPKVCCRACGGELVPAMNRDTDYQFDNALWVTFDGGYSMFIDPVDAEDRDRMRVVLCHDCAHELCEQVRWIAELLDPERSHAHRSEQHDELVAAGHRGWDLPTTG